jgi:hypothetical protein
MLYDVNGDPITTQTPLPAPTAKPDKRERDFAVLRRDLAALGNRIDKVCQPKSGEHPSVQGIRNFLRIGFDELIRGIPYILAQLEAAHDPQTLSAPGDE